MSLFLPKDFLYTGSIFSHSEFSLIKNFLQQTELKRNIQNLKFRFSLSFCKEKKQYKTKREPRRQKNKCKNKREGKKEERKRKRKKERKKKERKKKQKKGKEFCLAVSFYRPPVLASIRLSSILEHSFTKRRFHHRCPTDCRLSRPESAAAAAPFARGTSPGTL